MLARAVTNEWMRRSLTVAIATAALAAAGCGGGDGGSTSTASAQSPAQSTTPPAGGSQDEAPKISGTPGTQAKVGSSYSFTPVAQASDGDTLAFSVQNRPAWATFSTVTGQLSGTPKSEHAGQHGNIVITVSNGKAQAALPAFAIAVAAADGGPVMTPPGGATPVPAGAVTLQWTAPMLSTTGEALGDLAGYRIHYGKSEAALTHTIDVATIGTSTFMVENLPPGTYYFAVRAYTASGEQSALSNIRTVVIS